jgi:hypothetical protein
VRRQRPRNQGGNLPAKSPVLWQGANAFRPIAIPKWVTIGMAFQLDLILLFVDLRADGAVTDCLRMCGRFTNRLTWREIVALYRLAVPVESERNLPAHYNICPTDTIDVVVERGGRRDLVPMRWGSLLTGGRRRSREFRRPSTHGLKQWRPGQCFATQSSAIAA